MENTLLKPSNPPWRPDIKRRRILRALRRDFVNGRYKPNARLPLRTEIADRFDASAETVQDVLDRLKSDGFVIPRGRLGTFVAEHPPYLHHYGLVFTNDSDHAARGELSPFLAALAKVAARGEPGDSLLRYLNFHFVMQGHVSSDYERLREDAEAHRLAGLILPEAWDVQQRVRDMGVPIVTFGTDLATVLPDSEGLAYPIREVTMDMRAFRNRALDHLAAAGVERVGMILGCSGTVYAAEFEPAAAKRGIRVRSAWLQGVSLTEPHWAGHAVEAMMDRPASQRPQALVITDDTLLEPTIAGLTRLGLRVPQDVRLIAHANFPLAFPASVPCTRLGFSALEALRTAVDIINRLRQRKPVKPCTHIAPLFEFEFHNAAAKEAAQAKAVPA